MRLFYLTCLLLQWVQVSTGFERCLAETYVIHRIVGISLEKCQEECGIRRHCKAVNYRRNVKFCELLASEQGDNLTNQQACVFMKKTHMTLGHLNECDCADWETCDIETHECKTTECQKLSLPHGRILGNMMSVGSRVRFLCDSGYIEIAGETTAVCESAGNWSHQPNCVRVCDTLPSVQNATLVSGGVGVMKKGDVLQYNCSPGYELPNGNKDTLTCTDSGTWSGSSTNMCKLLTVCDTPSVPNATLVSGDVGEMTKGTVLQYNCSSGYKLVGNTDTITCTNSGTWSGSIMCELLTVCDTPSVPNATLVSGDVGVLIKGTELQYNCSSGYKLVGNTDTITCTNSGTWSGSIMCDPLAVCDILPNVPNANLVSGGVGEMTEGTVLQYNCSSGYKLVGNTNTLTCTNSGTWFDQSTDMCEMKIGSQCTNASQCLLTGAQCWRDMLVNGVSRCFCSPLYRYNHSVHDCVKECDTYLSTFTQIPDSKAIYISNDYEDSGCDAACCEDKCRNDLNCRSYEVWSGEDQCHRSSVSYEMFLDAIPSEIKTYQSFTMYSRDCE